MTQEMDMVILVDKDDKEIGKMNKLEAHQKGLLHRAFSVLLFNDKGEMLLQKRASGKYHSGGLWTNTCCSHPRPGEAVPYAAKRRLMEEMGIDLQPEFVYKFLYHTPLDKNLVEHELDHVFKGIYNGTPDVNPLEVEDWKYVGIEELKLDMEENPEDYTVWFKIIMTEIFEENTHEII